MSRFTKSRKFWIAVLDMIAGLIALYSGRFLSPDDARLIIQTWALMQPVLAVWVGSIAYEDGKALSAGVHPKQKEQ